MFYLRAARFQTKKRHNRSKFPIYRRNEMLSGEIGGIQAKRGGS